MNDYAPKILLPDTIKEDHILIVDDEIGIISILSEVLSFEGYKISSASGGKEAIEKTSNENPDLILLDLMMPEMDGFQVCQNIKSREETRHIPVVMLTALDGQAERLRGIEAGADDFLIKPVSRIELITKIKALIKIKHQYEDLESIENILFAFANLAEARDSYTGRHTARVSMYAQNLGRRIGLSHSSIEDLKRAGILHDIGKIGIPDHILNKQQSLTDEEFNILKNHSEIGYGICSHLKILKFVSKLVRWHHEKLDGSGYPDGISGEEIPVETRILSIADVYDSLMTDRPYRKSLSSKEAALGILIEESGKGWWDKFLVDEFIKLVDRNVLVE